MQSACDQPGAEKSLTGSVARTKPHDVSFLLAHLSDPHIGPLPKPLRRELVGKRLTGYLNWRGTRQRSHNMELLARLVADLRAQNPDHIAMTGDILNIGLAAEYPLARAWLETLGLPEDVSFVPGNHDAYVRSVMALLARTFAHYIEGDEPKAEGERLFPYLRRRGPVAIIGLSSGIPTLPFMASGKLGTKQSAALRRMLLATQEEGLARVVLVHHPPHRIGAPAARGLIDAKRFERVIADAGAELVLHGHNHSASVSHIAGPDGGRVPVVGVPSASAQYSRHKSAYHLFEFSGGPGAWNITGRSRGLHPGSNTIGDIRVLPL